MGSFHTQLGLEDRKQGTQEIINGRCSESKQTLGPCSTPSQISVLPFTDICSVLRAMEEGVSFNIISALKESYEVVLLRPSSA